MTIQSILLIISGSVASYKSAELVRIFIKNNIRVTVILSHSAKNFVTPLLFTSLGASVHEESIHDPLAHISLTRTHDIILLAPASANMISHIALGLSTDNISSLLLATKKKIFLAPAMNPAMWHHPAIQEHVLTLQKRGCIFIGPDSGITACAEEGYGRMTEPENIYTTLCSSLHKTMKGYHVVVTAGSTIEPIDPTRCITSYSSGKQGLAIAESFRDAGARVTLICGSTQSDSRFYPCIKISTAKEMLAACFEAMPCDVFIATAAVADYCLPHPIRTKTPKNLTAMKNLPWELSPDILHTISTLPAPQRPILCIGFTAETDFNPEITNQKRKNKACDWMFLNCINANNPAFGAETNQVTLFTDLTPESFPVLTKKELALNLVKRVHHFLKQKGHDHEEKRNRNPSVSFPPQHTPFV